MAKNTFMNALENEFNYDRTTGEEFLSESKTITEEKIEKNVVLTTRADGIMVSSKTYRTDFYSVENELIKMRNIRHLVKLILITQDICL